MKHQPSSPLRRLLTALVLPLVLVLAACEVTLDFEVSENDTVNLEMVMSLPKALAEAAGEEATCDALTADMPPDENLVVEDRSTDEQLRCVMRMAEPEPISNTNGGVRIDRDGDTFVTTIKADPEMVEGAEDEFGGLAPNLAVTFHYPGPVTDVDTTLPDSDYTISGNEVSFHTLAFFGADTTITAQATSGDAESEPTTEATPDAQASDDTTQSSAPASATSDDQDDSNSNWWWLIGIIVAAVVVVAVIVYQLRKNRHAGQQPGANGAHPNPADPFATPPVSGQYPQQTPGQYPQQTPGQYGQGRAGNQPYNPNQPPSVPPNGPSHGPNPGEQQSGWQAPPR